MWETALERTGLKCQLAQSQPVSDASRSSAAFGRMCGTNCGAAKQTNSGYILVPGAVQNKNLSVLRHGN